MLVNQITPITAGAIRSRGYSNLFDKHIGINTDNFTSDRERCAVTVVPQETALNVHGSVHGGWTAALLDTVASGSAYSHQAGGLRDDEYGLTASLNVEFNAPVFAGRKYACEGRIIGREGNNIKTRAAVTDDKGLEVATATALVKARRADY